MPDNGAGVIDPDVLWSCVTCGACVEQCPVDIEHVDHIVDMRRYQVLVESNFPTELNGLFKGLENKGNPWNMSATARMDWAKDLPFDVKVVGKDVESLDEVEWLFWVGCAGAYEDRAKKTTRAVAELLDTAGVNFAVLGNGETCTGDSARRAGNEFVFQGLAQQNIETFKEYKVKKVVSTCAHCFNTLKNEYRDLGYKMEVVHHTQLLNRLVREKKLTPIRTPERSWKGPHQRPITYHDPCYIGRHNQVYEAPRELLNVLPDTKLVEMPRNSERSFCCGAGGARMWMEETIGTRINETRTAEAVATGADQIAVGCPFCRVMLSDGLTSQQANGKAREEVEVLDVAQMLLAAVKGESKPAKKQAAAKSGDKAAAKSGDAGAGGGTAVMTKEADSEATKAEPEAGDATQTEETVTDTEDVGAAAKASSGGGSLFDIGGDSDDDSGRLTGESKGAETPANADDRAPAAPAEEPPVGEPDEKADAKSGDEGFGGGSLFDLGGDDSTETDKPAADPKVEDAGTEVDRSEDDADADVTPEGDDRGRDQGRRQVRGQGGDAGRSRRWRCQLHARQRDPRGRVAVRHRRTRGVRTRCQVRARRRGQADEEDPAGDSTTDADVDRSQDDADADVTPRRAEAEPRRELRRGGSTSTPGTEIPEGGSLFDIAEPEESAPAAKSEPAAGAGRRGGPGRGLHHRRRRRPQPGRRRRRRHPRGRDRGRGQDRGQAGVAGRARSWRRHLHTRHRDPRRRVALRHRRTRGVRTGRQGRARRRAGRRGGPGRGLHHRRRRRPQPGRRRRRRHPRGRHRGRAEAERQTNKTDDEPVTSLRDIKAKYADGSASDDEATGAAEETEDEPTDSEEPDESEDAEPEDSAAEATDAEEQKPKPASSGETHQPRTDAEIGEGGSLFDL